MSEMKLGHAQILTFGTSGGKLCFTFAKLGSDIYPNKENSKARGSPRLPRDSVTPPIPTVFRKTVAVCASGELDGQRTHTRLGLPMTWIVDCTDCGWAHETSEREAAADALERHSRKERHHVEITHRRTVSV